MKKLLLFLPLSLLLACNAAQTGGPINQFAEKKGESVSSDEATKSQMNRENGAEVQRQFALMDESRSKKELYLPEGYLEVPSAMTLESLTTKIDINKYNQECGNLTEATSAIGDRIADCKKIYKDRDVVTTWNNKSNGISGEGDWSLVSVVIDSSKETPLTTAVWYDFTTKLIWSDYIKDDTFNNAANSFVRTCSQFAANNPHSLTSNYVAWRLPTRGEFLQADLNGARYILNNTDKTYWTATLITADTAWSIEQSTSSSKSTSTADTSLNSIRCVGVPIL